MQHPLVHHASRVQEIKFRDWVVGTRGPESRCRDLGFGNLKGLGLSSWSPKVSKSIAQNP